MYPFSQNETASSQVTAWDVLDVRPQETLLSTWNHLGHPLPPVILKRAHAVRLAGDCNLGCPRCLKRNCRCRFAPRKTTACHWRLPCHCLSSGDDRIIRLHWWHNVTATGLRNAETFLYLQLHTSTRHYHSSLKRILTKSGLLSPRSLCTRYSVRWRRERVLSPDFFRMLKLGVKSTCDMALTPSWWKSRFEQIPLAAQDRSNPEGAKSEVVNTLCRGRGVLFWWSEGGVCFRHYRWQHKDSFAEE
jgi:hypothetical protein